MTEAGRHAGAELWAVTSYFNPMGYQRRRQNYRVFRERLTAPLAAVELSFDGEFELGPGDADLLIQLHGRDVMWHKERLLNLAIAQLPAACRAVAWLDCDVIFLDDNWPQQTLDQLQKSPLLQPFGPMYDLPRDADLPGENDMALRPRQLPDRPTAISLACGLLPGAVCENLSHLPNARSTGGRTSGLAWAASRELLARHGLYDARILGGGDRTMAAAVCGRYEIPRDSYRMNLPQFDHYRSWAEPFHASVQGQVGCLDGALLHLWHGELEDRRRPETRFGGFAQFEFDPGTDITTDEKGLWKWNSEKPRMHQFVRDYFAVRKEDG